MAKAYTKIFAEKKTEQFEFSEAARILGIPDERRLAKTLTRLKTSGHLMVRRDPVDARRKMFNLVDPVSVTVAFAIQSKAKSSDLIEKLKSATSSLEYYLNGAYAAYQYHHYSARAHTVGRRSAEPRINPMMYLKDGERYLVFASKGGSDTNPDWYYNLKAYPDVQIEIGDETIDVRAEEITGSEHDALYERQATLYPAFAVYQRRTKRIIQSSPSQRGVRGKNLDDVQA